MATGRRAPRQLANVEGICLLEDELAPDGWQVCWILDLSALGMGLMFRHQHEAELLGRTIAVEVPSATGRPLEFPWRERSRTPS